MKISIEQIAWCAGARGCGHRFNDYLHYGLVNQPTLRVASRNPTRASSIRVSERERTHHAVSRTAHSDLRTRWSPQPSTLRFSTWMASQAATSTSRHRRRRVPGICKRGGRARWFRNMSFLMVSGLRSSKLASSFRSSSSIVIASRPELMVLSVSLTRT